MSLEHDLLARYGAAEMRATVEILEQSLVQRRVALIRALQTNDQAVLRMTVHTLTSESLEGRLHALAEACARALENPGKEAPRQLLAPVLVELDAALAQVGDLLRRYRRDSR